MTKLSDTQSMILLAAAQLPGQIEPTLLDASTPHAVFGMLPERCLGTRARLITSSEKTQRWVPVKSEQQYTSFTAGTITPDAHGGATAALRLALTGYAGQRARRRASTLTPEELVNRYLTLAPGARITRQNLTQPDDPAQAVTLELDLTAPPDDAASAPGLVFVALKEFGGLAQNPFHAPERRFPVDLGAPLSETMMLDVAVPAGYAIETIPPPLNLRTPDGHVKAQFRCTPAEDGRSVQINSGLSVARASFAPEEYEALRTLYARLVAKHAEPLVFKPTGK